MTAECRPALGTKDGTWHNLLFGQIFPMPVTARWYGARWEFPLQGESLSPVEVAERRWVYLHPVTMPPRNLTREEMMEIAREAYLDPDATSTAWGLALTRIARGTAE